MAQKRSKRPARKKTATRKSAKKGRGSARKLAGESAAAAGGDRVAQLQRLIAVMVEAGAVEVELEEEGAKLRVRLKEEVPAVSYGAPHVLPHAPASGPQAGAPVPPGGEAPASAETLPGTEIFHSPMLGTFYRAPSPESEPFVHNGERVGPDATLCIIEAMKVMNEIKAEREMEIVDILVQNGDPVEYGQPLFVIKV